MIIIRDEDSQEFFENLRFGAVFSFLEEDMTESFWIKIPDCRQEPGGKPVNAVHLKDGILEEFSLRSRVQSLNATMHVTDK